MKKTDKWFWILMTLVVAVSCLYAERHKLYQRYLAFKAGEQQIQQQILHREQIKQEIETVRQVVNKLSNDPLEIEAAVRRSRDLVRQGETVYRIQFPDETQAPVPVEQTVH